MSLRKYWQRHPIQTRIVAAVLLLLMPIATPLVALVLFWREILATYAEHYREAWQVLMRGE